MVEEAGVSAIGFHPRPATVGHKGSPDYGLVRRLTELVDVPVIVSGGLSTADRARAAYERSGADAVMIARGSFGNPWIFEELLGRRPSPPEREEIVEEFLWVVDRAEEHLGAERAARYLRKFHSWYLARLEVPKTEAAEFDRIETLDEVRRRIRSLSLRAARWAGSFRKGRRERAFLVQGGRPPALPHNPRKRFSTSGPRVPHHSRRP
jgi:tRNA-dihydrouridine synthase